MSTVKAPPSYDESSITVLKGLEAVRVRPAMYIGDTAKKGLHHLVWEVLDNSVDEAMAGHCDTIIITVDSDGKTITIEDNGRGIPVGQHKTEKKSALEVVLTQLHAGGKFGGSGYVASGGLHGVGVSCVNALSNYLLARVYREGAIWEQEYSKGVPKGNVKKVGDSRKHGTSITFRADDTIFKDGIKFDEALLQRRFRETAFLNGGLKIVYRNKATGTDDTFEYKGGISDYVHYLTEAKSEHYPTTPFFCERYDGKVMVQVAMQFTKEDDETILTFANNINTHDGGTHLSGFKTALTRVVNAFGRKSGILKDKDSNLSGDDIREGLTAIISVRIPQPQFEGQTKAKLGSPEVESIVQVQFGEALTEFFEKNPAIVKMIVERAQLNQKAREAAKKQSEAIKKSGMNKVYANAGKLKPCQSRNRDETELFIVEGDSAAGSAKEGRDRYYQAVLPIRGKIINAEKKDLVSLLKNKEIESLISVIGCGIQIHGEPNSFNLDERRYSKIILMTDADVDGSHIATLLLTFFYRYMRPLVEGGFVYLAKPPLFKMEVGDKKTYHWSNEEMTKALAATNGKGRVTRFKGLGEMDDDELGETTMLKGNRVLVKVTIEDAADADRMLSVLMGKDISARKAHIVEHSAKRQAQPAGAIL